MIDDPDKTQEWVIDDVAELLERINESEKRYQTLIETNLYGVSGYKCSWKDNLCQCSSV